MSLYANLSPGDSLPDSDDISRYCSPGHYDLRRSEPRVSAFQRKPSERKSSPMGDPSGNRLQYFQLPDHEDAVECVRQEFLSLSPPYTLKPKGRFVVFNVGDAKAAVRRIGNGDYSISFTYDPAPPMYSHSLISNLPTDINEEREVATALKRLVTKAGRTFQATS